jgi:hypothetical protein
MEAVRLKCWALGVEREPRRFLTPQHKFIDRPDEAPAFLESQGRQGAPQSELGENLC